MIFFGHGYVRLTKNMNFFFSKMHLSSSNRWDKVRTRIGGIRTKTVNGHQEFLASPRQTTCLKTTNLPVSKEIRHGRTIRKSGKGSKTTIFDSPRLHDSKVCTCSLRHLPLKELLNRLTSYTRKNRNYRNGLTRASPAWFDVRAFRQTLPRTTRCLSGRVL